jgi:hypothetical protein
MDITISTAITAPWQNTGKDSIAWEKAPEPSVWAILCVPDPLFPLDSGCCYRPPAQNPGFASLHHAATVLDASTRQF